MILKDNEVIAKLYQGMKNTSNNRMEIMGVIKTLEYFKEPVEIEIHSDSSYVVNTINQKWCYKGFKENDLSKKNLDLGFKLIELLDYHKVTMVWTKGHADDQYNNGVDKMAVHSAQCLNIPEDANHKD